MMRRAVFAGSFYPAGKAELYKTVDMLLESDSLRQEKVPAIIAPHAGYIYSGKVAGLSYASADVPDTVIILGPNHRGMGEKVAVMERGQWEIPGGCVEIDNEMAKLILSFSNFAASDTVAHEAEHSIEVHLPFIARKNPKARIVPVCVAGADYRTAADLSDTLYSAVKEIKRDVLLVASTDMSHFISQEEARRLDFMAIEKMKNLDWEGLLEIVSVKEISMCGVLPSAAVIGAAQKLGASGAELIHYNTSAEVTGDTSEVVAYAGLKIR